MVKYFTEQKIININQKNYFGEMGFMLACKKGYLEIVKYLINQKVNIIQRNKYKNIGFLRKYENLELVKFLTEQGVDINQRDEKGKTVFLTAYINGHLKLIKLYN